ncbi:MAG: hypothetical protein WCN27_03485 [Alphaproteobacteria bacterium]
MRNTYYNRNISLTVLTFAIALSTSLSAAQVLAPVRYSIQLDSFDEKLPPITVPAIGGVQTEIFLDKGRELASTYNFDKNSYQFYKLTPTLRTLKENETFNYDATQILKGEEGYIDIVKNGDLTSYMYTPEELFVGQIQLVYRNNSNLWGVCTIDVKPGLAKRVQQLEKAVREEKCEVRQLNVNQTQLATVLSILNNWIDELNAKPVGLGEWFKWLWR